ncbi:DMT family transporter [Thalassotalea piscium]|uniref:Drug/metabolite transporter (DMT)-like permease n=1 Tax=Thalassotalea piscium TaxID=1230533 RepID=A0A7X0NIH8_9GAMM|nr:DMT family transporter [Thalassotalea piscium]MBB6543998.1 drug/metabolite transporter (DMT)-like permease [Thalassotalea piscium]
MKITLKKFIPFLFVILWSTGFIGAKYGLPYAGTGDFLSIRTVGNILIFILLLLLLKQPKLSLKQVLHSMVTGVLIHGAYLGGVFAAIEHGIPAGVTAIIVGLQPLLTAFIAMYLFKELLSRTQWLALAIGVLGIALVVSSQVDLSKVSVGALIYAFIALLGITVGTLYQKKFCQHQPLLPSVLWQYIASLAVFLPLAYVQAAPQVSWQPEFIYTLLWLVIALSAVSILLLLYMIEHGAASKVASYFYLVPPATAFQAWLLFDERLSLVSIIGMIICVASVYVITHKTNKLNIGSKP